MSTTMQDTKGRPITAALIRRGMRINMGVGALGMAWFALALGMPLTMFMERLGARDVAIGMVVTVQFLAMVMQIPSALLAERLTNRKRYWGGLALVHRLVWFLPPLIPLFLPIGSTAGWAMLVLVAVSSLLAHASAAPWYSWIVDLVPEGQRNRFWARRQSITQAAFLVAMGIGGWILDRYSGDGTGGSGFLGFHIVFVLAGIAGVADILLHLLVPEPRPHRVAVGIGWTQRLRKPFADRDFLWLTLAFGAWSFGLGLVGSFGFLYLRRNCGATYTHLAAFTVCAALGTVVASPLWGKVMDHVGERTFALAMFVLAPICGLQWFFLPQGMLSLGTIEIPAAIVQVCAIALLSGAFYTGPPLAQVVLSSAVTRKEGRTLAMAVHWTLVGAVGAAGPLIGGWVMDWTASHPIPFRLPMGRPVAGYHVLVLAHMLVSWLVAIPLLLRMHPRHGKLSVRALAGNPLRVASLIQNLVTLGEASSWQTRARAVRTLGRKRLAHAVGELVANLDDPISTVREEAARALGRIGGPRAVDALLEHFADPESDLSIELARALGEAGDERAVAALLAALESQDPPLRRESARALGTIGDPRAVGPLLKLVGNSPDLPLATAAATALARLGEPTAVPEMLPRLRQARNPALRTSLAVSIADLIGVPGTFYPVLAGEKREPGSRIPGMLSAIRSAVARVTDHAAPELRGLADRIEETMAATDFAATAAALLDLATGMAALRLGGQSRPEPREMAALLGEKDPRIGNGLTYLVDLNRRADALLPEQRIDLLVGVHFLRQWADSWQERPPRDEASRDRTTERPGRPARPS